VTVVVTFWGAALDEVMASDASRPLWTLPRRVAATDWQPACVRRLQSVAESSLAIVDRPAVLMDASVVFLLNHRSAEATGEGEQRRREQKDTNDFDDLAWWRAHQQISY
jgi:hypothetical protein